MTQLTDEQSAIVEYVRRGQGDLLIEAIAGSGKTFAILEALKVIPQRSILICAFNRKIADELKARAKAPAGAAMHIDTFHAIGKRIISQHFPKLRVDKNATEMLITKTAGDRPLGYAVRRAATRLLRQYKELDSCDVDAVHEVEDFEKVGQTYELFDKLTSGAVDEVIALAMSAYTASHDPENLEAIDFCDMIWMPVALDLTSASRYQAILVDEWQDISEPQLELIRRLRAPVVLVPGKPGQKQMGRLIMAGDGRQAINGWRGAVAQTVRNMMLDECGATTLTLSTSWRCSKAVIAEASGLVHGIRAAPDALEGSITHVGLNDVPRMIFQGYSETIHTFILSRNNKSLLDTALLLWREGVRFQLNAGQEMLKPLFELLDLLDLRDAPRFKVSLLKWHAEQTARANAAETVSIAFVEALDERRDMLLAAVHYGEPSGLRRLFQSILEPGKTGVLLSTVHKVKGLEADRVFLLKQTFARWKDNPKDEFDQNDEERMVQLSDWVDRSPSSEDLNIEYVAITRAKEHLIWVDMNQREMAAAPSMKADPALIADMLRSLDITGLEQEFDKAEGEIQRLGLSNPEEADAWSKHAALVLAEISSR